MTPTRATLKQVSETLTLRIAMTLKSVSETLTLRIAMTLKSVSETLTLRIAMTLKSVSENAYPRSSQSNNVPSPVPLRSGFRGLGAGLMPASTSSQLVNSIGGGTTRTRFVRFTTSVPFPPRLTVGYAPPELLADTTRCLYDQRIVSIGDQRLPQTFVVFSCSLIPITPSRPPTRCLPATEGNE